MKMESLVALLQPLPRKDRADAVFNAAVAAVASLPEERAAGLVESLRGHPSHGMFENIAWAASFERRA